MGSKSRSLPLTELANLFGRAAETQEVALKNFLRPPGPIPSYSLSKRCLPEIFGATGGLLGSTDKLTGDKLWDYVTARARGNMSARDFNWPVSEALSDFAAVDGFQAVHREFDAVSLVGGQRTKLVGNVIALVDGRPSLICLDPRRTNFLTAGGLHVVQSLIHHLLRTQYPDLADLDIAVLQFRQLNQPLERDETMKRRVIVANRLGDREAMSWSDLDAGITKTLTIFQSLLQRRPPEAPRRTGTDDLFDR